MNCCIRTSYQLNFVINIFFFLSVSFLLFLQPEMLHAQDAHRSVLKKVVLDPGHGGRDPGALGAKSKEKDIVLDVALRIGKKINEKYPEVEVIYTRKTDVFVELSKRGDIANEANADLFISIHANSVAKGSKCPSGTATFVMGTARTAANMEVAKRENSVILLEEDHTTRYQGFDPNRAESYIIFELMQHLYLNQSTNFAIEIQDQFKSSAKRVDRGKHQANFLVLWRTAMPSVLVEIGFICNPEEEKFMISAAGKDQLATAIFQAFSSYKSKIDERSLFDTSDQNESKPAVSNNKVEPKPSTPTNTEPKPATPNKTETKPATPTNTEPKPATPTKTETKPATPTKAETKAESKPTVSNSNVEFCIQIFVSSTQRETSPNNFKNYTNVERFQESENLFKYIVYRSSNYSAVEEKLEKVKADFDGAFIVSIVNGKIVPAAEGLKLIDN